MLQALVPAPQNSSRVRTPVLKSIVTDILPQGVVPQTLEGAGAGACYCLAATAPETAIPQKVFERLRWGGQFVFDTASARQAEALSGEFARNGFDIELPPTSYSEPREGWRKLLPARRRWCFVARKTHLVLPGETTDRFTYSVHLQHNSGGEYIVCKQVPTVESVTARLRRRWTEASDELIEKRARKFMQVIFPTFLTREAAMLRILKRDLPEPFARRVPHLIDMEQDERGFVHTLRMNWLRSATRPITHLDFAHQSAELLSAIHDRAGIIHLDLRLDNFVITDEGVSFVDFGSSVRVGEELGRNPLLGALFDDLLRTSQIQHMLQKLTLSGHVTSQIIQSAHRKVDKAVDFFYLAVQFSAPHGNPDLKDLILYDPGSAEARAITQLTESVLKPTVASDPPFKSAQDIVHGLDRVKQRLADSGSALSTERAEGENR
jgi:hypothetical protein